MAESLLQKVQNEARMFTLAPIYPFLQPDWLAKMWLFAALSYVPLVNIIIARGWRMDYIRRIGWRHQRVLPNPQHTLMFLKNGLLLWLSTGVFVSIPLIVFTITGFDGLIDLSNDILTLFGLLADYFLRGTLSTGEFVSSMTSFLIAELLTQCIAFLAENIWLILYIPVYRIGMIRFALTGNLLQSHLSFRKNFRFIYRNFVDIVLMYAFNILNFLLVIMVDVVLSITVVGAPLIPIVTFFMPFWNSGFEYGMLARMMVEQEGLQFEDQRKLPYERTPAMSVSDPMALAAPTVDAPASLEAASFVGVGAATMTLATATLPEAALSCVGCGAALRERERFCGQCGEKTEAI